MVIVSLPVYVHVDVHDHVHDGERAIRSEERISRQSSRRRGAPTRMKRHSFEILRALLVFEAKHL